MTTAFTSSTASTPPSGDDVAALVESMSFTADGLVPDELLGLDRFDLKYSHGPLAHEKLMHGIELYGTQVIPRVRELLAD